MAEAVYEGLHRTNLELIIWQDRADDGPFRVANDATGYPVNPANNQRNTPGDWLRITNNKSSWETVSGKAGDRYTNYPTGSPTTPLPADQGGKYDPLTDGVKIRDASFYYLVKENTTGQRNVILELLAIINTLYSFGGVNDLKAFDFNNTARWHSKLGDVNPWFVICEYLVRLMYAYDYSKSQATAGEKATIHAWFLAAGRAAQRSLDHSVSDLYVDRDGGNYNFRGNIASSGSAAYKELHRIGSSGVYNKVVYYGGQIGSVAAHRYSNRRVTVATMMALSGVLSGNQPLINAAKLYFKECLRFSWMPGASPNSDVVYIDFMRWTDSNGSDPNKGYNYTAAVIANFMVVADALARKGDTEMWTYASTLGTSPAQSSALGASGDGATVKGFLTAAKYMIDLKQGKKLRYASNTATTADARRIRGYSTALNRYNAHDIIHNLAYIFTRDQAFYKSAARTAVGELPLPISAQNMGALPIWEIGQFPAALFMFGLPDGWPVVHPTGGTGLLSQTIDAPSLANVSYSATDIAFLPTASSGLPVSVAVTAGASLVNISNGRLYYKGVGSVTMVFTQGGNNIYAAASFVTRNFTISKGTIAVQVNNATRQHNRPEPPFSANYSGFKTGEDASNIDVLPTFATTAVLASNTGNYAITASGASDANYNFTYTAGVLAITKAELTITITNTNLNLLTSSADVQLTWTVVDRVTLQTVALTPTFSRLSGTSATVTSGGLVDPDNTITGTSVIEGITPSNGNYSRAAVNRNVVVTATAKTAQTITGFSPDTTVTIGDVPGLLVAIGGGSGNPVTFSTSDAGTISTTGTNGRDASYLQVGEAVLYANQAGNATYADAPTVAVTVSVAKKALLVTIDDQSRQYKDANPIFTYVISGGYVSGETIANIDQLPTLNATDTTDSVPGTYVISGSGATDDKYSFTYVNGVLTVTKADQTIDFGTLASHPVGDAPFLLTGGASSGLPVSYASSVPGVASVAGDEVTPVDEGSTLITASQAGDSNYNAAPDVIQSLTITDGQLQAQFITLTPVGNHRKYGQAPFALEYTVTSDLEVTVEVISGPATWNAGTGLLTITGATDEGTGEKVKLKLSQAGDSTWAPADDVYEEFIIGKGDQFLSLDTITDKEVNDTFDVVFSSTSGLTPVATGNGFLTQVDSNTFTTIGVGVGVITVTQAGNANYNAASPLERVFNIAVDGSPTGNVTLLTLASAIPRASNPDAAKRTLGVNGKYFYRFQIKWAAFNVPKDLSGMLMESGGQTGTVIFNNRQVNYKVWVRLVGAGADDWTLSAWWDNVTQSNVINRGIPIEDVIQVKEEADGQDLYARVQKLEIYGKDS